MRSRTPDGRPARSWGRAGSAFLCEPATPRRSFCVGLVRRRSDVGAGAGRPITVQLCVSPSARWTLPTSSAKFTTVFERYGKQEGSLKGHNPRKHGRPSHHPLLAVQRQLRNQPRRRGVSQRSSRAVGTAPEDSLAPYHWPRSAGRNLARLQPVRRHGKPHRRVEARPGSRWLLPERVLCHRSRVPLGPATVQPAGRVPARSRLSTGSH